LGLRDFFYYSAHLYIGNETGGRFNPRDIREDSFADGRAPVPADCIIGAFHILFSWRLKFIK